VRERLAAAGHRLLSLDAVVVADAPRLKPHRAAVRESLARLFGIDADRVNLKAKTREGVAKIAGCSSWTVSNVERVLAGVGASG